MRRGVFILFEGIDRCGKTTQTKLLHEALQNEGHTSTLLHFPDRSTPIGKSIHAYLTSQTTMDDHAIHLLFAANRWEAAAKIESYLRKGIHIIMDRYVYSGVAFSSAKPNMTLEWCWQPEIGLPKPDAVIFLDLPISIASKRPEYGQEVYETTAFQQKVYANFHQIRHWDPSVPWHCVDASSSIDIIHAKVMAITKECIEKCAFKPLGYLLPLTSSHCSTSLSP